MWASLAGCENDSEAVGHQRRRRRQQGDGAGRVRFDEVSSPTPTARSSTSTSGSRASRASGTRASPASPISAVPTACCSSSTPRATGSTCGRRRCRSTSTSSPPTTFVDEASMEPCLRRRRPRVIGTRPASRSSSRSRCRPAGSMRSASAPAPAAFVADGAGDPRRGSLSREVCRRRQAAIVCAAIGLPPGGPAGSVVVGAGVGRLRRGWRRRPSPGGSSP